MRIQIVKFKNMILLISLMSLIGCSSMPTTDSGFLSESHSPSSLKKESITVVFRANTNELNNDEKERLTIYLLAELKKHIEPSNLDLSSIQLSAAITRIETVSPLLNWLFTITLFAPIDRGGAAVEFRAIDTDTAQTVAELQFAQWAPMSEFTAQYKRLKPAKLALTSATHGFIEVLKNKIRGKLILNKKGQL